MLACVCRPVSSSLPKSTLSTGGAPQKRPPHVVTCEPRIATATILKKKVPGRPSGAELRAMALRQQQQIDSQHQLLAAKEQRLRFLKAQEVRGAAAAAEGERLRRLRERVEAQESKLRRLRALRGQVDLQKTYNVTLSNDLDSIRALFSEKEKELSLAVAKVEALTRQLEDLRRDRRGPLNLIPGGATSVGGNGANQQITASPAALELDKLRRELMYRNQVSLQQDARLHLQREALQQRQAELRSVDQRILELQSRLQKKKASNLLLQPSQHLQPQQNSILTNNIALQLLANNAPLKPSNSVYPSQRNFARGNNVAAVEPYMHTPQKQSIKSNQQQQLKKHPQQQLLQDLTNLKLNLHHTNNNINVNHITLAESDESKLARQKIHFKQNSKDLDNDGDFSTKKSDPKFQTLPYNNKYGLSKSASSGAIPYNSTSLINRSNESDNEKAGGDSDSSLGKNSQTHQQLTVHSTPLNALNKSLAVPISTSASVNSGNSSITSSSSSSSISSAVASYPVQQPFTRGNDKPTIKPKAKHQIPSGNLVVPPRKPISSVAPTTITMAPKVVSHSPKVNMVMPNVTSLAPIVSSAEFDKSRPALPPKPTKNTQENDNTTTTSTNNNSNSNNLVSSVPTVVSVINKLNTLEPVLSNHQQDNQSPTAFPPNTDNLPIKARPLTIKKQPLSEQPPKLRSINTGIKPIQYTSRRIEMPPAFLFPEIEKGNLKDKSDLQSPNGNNSIDDTDKSTVSSINDDENQQPQLPSIGPDVMRRSRSTLSENGKAKLARRVSFDPLALLLDASLEGELELVKKTTMQVPNPSAANDEGITALHNAICAGHFSIVKFLVEYGCDVNAQDSDGWTPLHCAASCNNLEMVKFLVESGACLFAATLSDHETPAEKCEEDEEGFDGCSEYLYSIQEKLGILNNGEVYAVFSYDSQQQDELSFDVNDRLTILRKGDDAEREWWWAKIETGEEGYVPRNLLGLYPRVPLQHQID